MNILGRHSIGQDNGHGGDHNGHGGGGGHNGHGGGDWGRGRRWNGRDWSFDFAYPSLPYAYLPYVVPSYPYYPQGLPQLPAAPQGAIMNQFNPYYPYLQQYLPQQAYPYAMVGQDVPQPLPMTVPQLPGPFAGPMLPYGYGGGLGVVPAGPVVPSLASNLPTHPVLAVAQAVDAPAVSLQPVLGIGQCNNLFPGFLSRKKRICGCSCEVVTLRSNLPFRIERLIVEGCNARDFQIEQIIIGQRVLTTGNRGFPAKYLSRRGRGGGRGGRGWGCGFDLNVDIDFQHPLKIWVRNKDDETHKFKIFAEGVQLAL